MEDKNNCPVDPFLEKEQDEVFIEMFFNRLSVLHCESFRMRSRVIKSTCLPSSPREGFKRLTRVHYSDNTDYLYLIALLASNYLLFPIVVDGRKSAKVRKDITKYYKLDIIPNFSWNPFRKKSGLLRVMHAQSKKNRVVSKVGPTNGYIS